MLYSPAENTWKNARKAWSKGQKKMEIGRESPRAYEEVRAFYHALIDAMQSCKYSPGWKKDIYPSPEALKEALGAGTLYTGRIRGQIVAAMVVNQEANAGYDSASWPFPLEKDEYLVIHMLGVHPNFARQGLGSQLVEHAVSLARQSGMQAVRLDVLAGNLPAERLYTSLGFQYVQTLSMFYEDTGWTDYGLYEYLLDEDAEGEEFPISGNRRYRLLG